MSLCKKIEYKYCSKVIYLYKIEFINGSNELVEYNIRIGVK